MKRLLALLWAPARATPVDTTPPAPDFLRVATKEYVTKADDGTSIATHICCFGLVENRFASTVDSTHDLSAALHQDLLRDRAAWAYHGDLPEGCRRIGEARRASPVAEIVPLSPSPRRAPSPTGGSAA